MLREGTDPSGPRGNHPTGAPRWVHSWLYRRNPPPTPPPPPPPPVPAASPVMIHPRRPPAPPASVHRPFPRHPRLTATSFSLSVLPPPAPSPPRHCRWGCSSSSGGSSKQQRQREHHHGPGYPLSTSHKSPGPFTHRGVSCASSRDSGNGISAADGIGRQIGRLRDSRPMRRAHLCPITRLSYDDVFSTCNGAVMDTQEEEELSAKVILIYYCYYSAHLLALYFPLTINYIYIY